MTVLTCNSNGRQNVNLNSDLLETRDRPAHYSKIFREKLRHAVLIVGFCQTAVVHVCVESITTVCKHTKNVFWGLACAYSL